MHKGLWVVPVALLAILSVPAGTRAAVPALQADLYGPADEEFGIGCSLACAVDWKLTASSAHAPQGANRYGAEQAEDGDLKTAWVPAGDGIGATLSFDFKPEHFRGRSTTFRGLEVINGYTKSRQSWEENARVKRLRIDHNGQPLYEVLLHDAPGVQSVSFDSFDIRAGSRVTLVILEVYPGSRYRDVAITEIVPEGAH